MGTIKPLKDLVFSDDFMFGLIMNHADVCKTALEILLDMKIDRIEYPEPQKSIAPLYTSKGIRLDVYADDGRRVYDVEIQNSEEVNLGKRARYYQSMLDTELLNKGKTYGELKESIIIFLCRYDPFQNGIPCYTIQNRCLEDRNLILNDEATLYVFNCKAYEDAKTPELRAFLGYIMNNRASSDFTRRLYDMVESHKEMEETKHYYKMYGLFEQDTLNRGRQEGEAKKAMEAAKNLLAMKLGTYEQIAQAEGLPLETVVQLAHELETGQTAQL